MFSLLCGLYSTLTEKPEFKILMVGLDGAGKTVGIFILCLDNQ